MKRVHGPRRTVHGKAHGARCMEKTFVFELFFCVLTVDRVPCAVYRSEV
jgi:hypothetical protein